MWAIYNCPKQYEMFFKLEKAEAAMKAHSRSGEQEGP